MVITNKLELLEHFDLYVSGLCATGSAGDKEGLKDLAKLIFSSHADINYNLAKDLFLHHKEMSKYNSYLTEMECDKIIQELHREHGRSSRWSNRVELFRKLEERGVLIEEAPHYNKFALHAFMEKIFLTHTHIFDRLTSHATLESGINKDEEILKVCYELAVVHLKHDDCDDFIREYFDVD